MTETPVEPWATLIGKMQGWRADRSSFTRELAAVRKGATSTTEHYAYPYVLPYTKELSTAQQTALLRATAMLAEYPDIATYRSSENGNQRRPFGAWCYQLTSVLSEAKGNPQPKANDSNDPVGRRLAYLHTQSLEEAAQSIRRLLAMANSTKNAPALDVYELVRLLLRWGNGLSPESQQHRQKILRDYYSAFIYRPSDENPTAATQED